MNTKEHALTIYEEYYDMIADLTNDFTLQGRRKRVDIAMHCALIFCKQMQEHCSADFYSYWIAMENELNTINP